MRAFPSVAHIGDGPWALGDQIDLPIRLHAVRAIFVTWSEFVFDGLRHEARREAFTALARPTAILDDGLPNYYELNIIGSDYAVGASQNKVEAARRAIGLLEAVDSLEFRDAAFDDIRYDDFLDTIKCFGPSGYDEQNRWRAAQRDAIALDCAILQNGRLTTRDLALAPLWPNPECAALETNLMAAKKTMNRRELGEHIENWLEERKDGALILNMPAEQARERIVRTANLPRSFWESRSAADTLYAFDYCLYGDLGNPSWGSETSRRI